MAAPVRLPRRKVSGIVLLDKPLGLSSNEALQRVKRLYRADKAGHTGSLDPLATGALPICLGEATKLSGVLLESDKRYVAVVRVGMSTSTGDAEGQPIGVSDPGLLDEAALRAALARFVGPQQQIPPMYSALKLEGRPLYERARAGETVERAARRIEIHALALRRFAHAEFEIDVQCSKGTYIRTLAEDIAAAVGQCAHLVGLRRTEVSPFIGEPWITLAELEALKDDLAALDRHLLAPAAGLRHWPALTVDDVIAKAFACGRPQRVPGVLRGARLAVVDAGGALLGLAESDAEGWVRPQRWLVGAP